MRNLKTKIIAGLIFLFAVVLTLSLVGIIFINQLANDSGAIIKDNYHTIDYSTKMLKSLDMMFTIQSKYLITPNLNQGRYDSFKSEFAVHKNEFEKNLNLESKNITEIGEQELVNELLLEYKKYTTTSLMIEKEKNASEYLRFNEVELRFERIRNYVQLIYNLNMNAILDKNQIAKQTASNVTYYMSIIGAVSSLLTFIFIIYFPGYIYLPITQLIEKIKHITSKEYNQRIDISANDELGELMTSFNSMAAKLQEYENHHINQLLLEKKRIEALVQCLQDGVIVLDEANHIVIINKFAQVLLNLDEVETIGEIAQELSLKNDLLKKIITYASNYILDPTNDKPLKITNNNKEEYIKVEAIDINRKNETGDFIKIGQVIMVKDITKFEQRNLDKINLLATVSHELKTPISSINLSIKLLEDSRIGNMNIEQVKLTDSIKHQTKRLISVVNELLNYSQVETGKIELKIANIEPYQIVELSIFALMMQINGKQIILDVKIDDYLPKVKADLEKSTWVLVNILNNAIRYSTQGAKINIELRQADNFIYFCVQDFGIGIEPEVMERIFDKFSTAKNLLRKGTGLGLAIAKEFVESQGGTITATSVINEGSKFTFNLPIAEG
ncbi:MAG: ATP-binding protein [bacterium]